MLANLTKMAEGKYLIVLDNFELLRHVLRWTNEDIANAIGLSRQTVSYWLRYHKEGKEHFTIMHWHALRDVCRERSKELHGDEKAIDFVFNEENPLADLGV